MALTRNKWYVVWHGHQPGVYSSWEACRAQVEGVPGARYKGFPSHAEALAAMNDGAGLHVGRGAAAPKASVRRSTSATAPIIPSWSVDAACDMTTGVMEYRGVETATQTELFRMGPYDGATNNIGEFLAIVHALSLQERHGIVLPIYSDSRTALAWLRHRKAKTTVERTAKNAAVFALLDRAEAWLQKHTWKATVLKWETEHWGENPADFGRK